MQCHASEEEPSTSTSGQTEDSLLIVGPGVLGGLVGKLYKEENPSSSVIGQTNTETNHKRYASHLRLSCQHFNLH